MNFSEKRSIILVLVCTILCTIAFILFDKLGDQWLSSPASLWLSIPVLLCVFVVVPIYNVLRKYREEQERRVQLLYSLSTSLALASLILAICSFSTPSNYEVDPWSIVVIVIIAVMGVIEWYYKFIAPRFVKKK